MRFNTRDYTVKSCRARGSRGYDVALTWRRSSSILSSSTNDLPALNFMNILINIYLALESNISMQYHSSSSSVQLEFAIS